MALSKKEREDLERQLKEDAEEREREKDRFEVEIGKDGSYGRLPYEKAKAFFEREFGLNLSDVPAQEEPDPDAKGGDDKPVRFGRRVS